jgi:hypothetical protein
MLRALTILYRPSARLRELKSRPAWGTLFLGLAVLSVIAFVAEYPALVRATLENLPPAATEADRARAAEWMGSDLLRRAAFLPVRLLGGWSAFALLLLSGVRAFGLPRGIAFAHMLTMELHAELVLVFGALLAAAGAPGEGILYAPALGGGSLHATLNLCTLWYVSLLVRGVSVLCDTGPRKAFLIVFLSWGIGQALNFGVLSLLQHTFRMV